MLKVHIRIINWQNCHLLWIATHDDCNQLRHRVAEVEMGILDSMANRRRYLENVRQCCAELLSMHVELVIRLMLKHVHGYKVSVFTYYFFDRNKF